MSRFLTATALSLSLALGAVPAFAAGAGKSSAMETTQGKQVRAEQVIGSDVYNSAGERVGEIEDLVINQKDEVTYAIVDVGGFLGLGEHQVALPFDEFTARDSDTLMMSESLDEDQLREMQAYERNASYKDVPDDRMVMWPQGQKKASP